MDKFILSTIGELERDLEHARELAETGTLADASPWLQAERARTPF